MKKMWVVAAIACAALMVSCGGEQKADDETVDVDEKLPTLVKAVPIEEKVIGFYQEFLAAGEDEAKGNAIVERVDAYYQTLSEEDKVKFDEAWIAVLKEVAIQEVVPENANPVVVAKAIEFADKMVVALATENEALVAKIEAEYESYLDTISAADQELCADVANAVLNVAFGIAE